MGVATHVKTGGCKKPDEDKRHACGATYAPIRGPEDRLSQPARAPDTHNPVNAGAGPHRAPTGPPRTDPAGTGFRDFRSGPGLRPRAVTREQMAALADLLRRGGAISDRDLLILKTDPTAGRMAVARDLAAPRDAIRDWQARRAMDMELGRIQAVEASTRALAILGRIAAFERTAGAPESPTPPVSTPGRALLIC